MRSLFAGVATSFVAALAFAPMAQATVDGHDQVALVVQHVQSEEFFVEKTSPIIGCYGLPRGARLLAWTSEYKVPSNIGCGGQKYMENINALTCAKVVSSKESADYMTFSEITLDISKCEAKNKPQFITMIRTTAKYNFEDGTNTKLVLNLVK